MKRVWEEIELIFVDIWCFVVKCFAFVKYSINQAIHKERK